MSLLSVLSVYIPRQANHLNKHIIWIKTMDNTHILCRNSCVQFISWRYLDHQAARVSSSCVSEMHTNCVILEPKTTPSRPDCIFSQWWIINLLYSGWSLYYSFGPWLLFHLTFLSMSYRHTNWTPVFKMAWSPVTN